MGASGRYWAPVAELVSAQRAALAPDLLGFGRSPWPDVSYSLADHLAALQGLLTEPDLRHTRPVLVGHSAGSILALEWAARLPDAFSGLLLIDLPAFRDEAEAKRHIGGLGFLASATAERPWLGRLICGTMCRLRPIARMAAPHIAHDMPAEVARDGVLHTWRSYYGTLSSVILKNNVERAASAVHARFTGPVRLLHGQHDRTAPLDLARGLAAHHGWPLQTVPGADHNVPLIAAAAVAAAINELDS